MSARAIWKGSLKVGAEKVSVKLYSAVEDRTVHFHILEEKTLTRVKQQMVNPDTGKPVDREQIQRGLEVEPGTFVILHQDELEKLDPEASRGIEIKRFVPTGKINAQWYDRPYYLGPDGADEAYFALAEALQKTNQEGIAQWVMRKKHYAGALQASGDGYLALVTLRHQEEVLSPRELPKPSGRELDAREVQMAEQLVSVLAGVFDPAEFTDEYRDRVMKFIDSKAAGRKMRLMPTKAKEPSTSLMDALSASLKKAKNTGGKAVA